LPLPHNSYTPALARRVGSALGFLPALPAVCIRSSSSSSGTRGLVRGPALSELLLVLLHSELVLQVAVHGRRAGRGQGGADERED
jgi:hypothetical protein